MGSSAGLVAGLLVLLLFFFGFVRSSSTTMVRCELMHCQFVRTRW